MPLIKLPNGDYVTPELITSIRSGYNKHAEPPYYYVAVQAGNLAITITTSSPAHSTEVVENIHRLIKAALAKAAKRPRSK